MIDFLKYQKYCFAFSICLLVLGGLFFVKRNGFVYGIDFTGGSQIRLKFTEIIDASFLRTTLEQSDKFKEVVLQNVGENSDYLLKIQESGDSVEQDITNILKQSFEGRFSIDSIERVGPEAGKEVSYNALLAILWTFLALGLYITLRQKMAFAIGAIAALIHDLLVILVYYLITGETVSVNVLMGILAVLGYSINDTVVIFNRITGNLGLLKKMSPSEVVNLSINQTFSRTMLTSISTFISVFMLFLFGGVALKSLSVTIILGVIFGTYSSIYIASPVMLFFDKYLESYKTDKSF